MRDSKPLITTGERGVYSWIEWNYQADFLSNLLRSFPELVVGRYLINTSFDSGPLPRSDDEIANGWDELNGSTLSPLISTADEIPTCGYDEWYVFQQPSRLECFEVFVNYGGFSLHSPHYEETANRFWAQIGKLEPETYLSEGDFLICVTKNKPLLERLKSWRAG